ncbi:recombinase zinc beta ribbon domain-containing protein [Bradyrhizobium sp. CCBAU 11357]|uniref:recombinase zinc beta ribbon domain-containing protein n=1 Tax=Bradyrhizobium sp. CCBAU 11357 TaxID=1630808 RepID=UPI0023048F6D|nr:recombinase zinc beta ribbon domain-containing protein [Bradyrhizobium sp. CCBAU 11357]
MAAGYSTAGVSVKIRRKARNAWLTLKPNTHEGYVSWEKFEAIRTMVSSNVPTSSHHGAPKHGDALLAGLIRCKRCGRKLTLRYSGMESYIPRYSCSRAWMDMAGPPASPWADCASMMPSRKHCLASSVRARSPPRPLPPRELGSGAIRYAMLSVATSKRRPMPPTGLSGNTMTADPANRLVASELEARWNRELAHAAEIKGKIAMHDVATPAPIADPASFGVLASNLKTVWDAPTTDARLRSALCAPLIHEVVADIDDVASEIVLIVHWVGGAHSELRLPKRRQAQQTLRGGA